MAIFRLIKETASRPDQSFHLKTGTDSINEIIAKKIIGIVQADEKDPKRICARTIRELGIQDLGQ